MKTTEEIRTELLGLTDDEIFSESQHNPLFCQYAQWSDDFMETLKCTCIKTHKIIFIIDAKNYEGNNYESIVREYCKYHTIKLIKNIESGEAVSGEDHKFIITSIEEIENNE